MSTNQPIAGPEELLAHAGFLGGLVRTLVFDQEQAEDYLQDTWAYALANPPKSGPGLKTWLATAARNYIRQDRRSRNRRTRREIAVARPERLCSTDEVLAREEARRRVVEAVRKLSEPYRTAVVLRYLEDLPPREIARRENVPVETVRTRLKRALALLRKELDERSDGDRRTWCLALLPLTLEKEQAAAAIGGVGLLGGIALMSTKLNVALAAVLLALILVVGLVVLSNPGRGEQPVAPDPHPGREDVAVLPGDQSAPAMSDETGAGMEPDESAVPLAARIRVRLAFTDEHGRAISPDEVVRLYVVAGMPLAVRVVPESFFSGSDVADLFRSRAVATDDWAKVVPIVSEEGELHLGVLPEEGRYRLLVGRPNAAPMLSSVFNPGEGDVELCVPLPSDPDTRRYRLVAAEDGAPLPGATVTPWYEFGDDQVFIPGPALVADGQGEVEIAVLEEAVRGGNRQPTWWIETKNHLGKIPRQSLHLKDGGNTATIEVLRSSAVEGFAYLANGELAAGRVVVWTDKGRAARTVVGEDGTFRVAPVSPGYGEADLVLIEDLEPLKIQIARVKVVPGETAGVRIGKPVGEALNAVITGHVTAGGRPLPGVFVVTRTEGTRDGKNFIQTGRDGSYRKEDVAPGQVRLQLYFGDPVAVDDFYTRSSGAMELAAGDERVFDFDLPSGAFEVTVVDDETGEPIPGALTSGRPMDRDAGTDRFSGFLYRPGWGLRVGEDGSAVLLAMLPGEPHRVRARAEGYQDIEIEDQIPGTMDHPAKVSIRMKKKE